MKRIKLFENFDIDEISNEDKQIKIDNLFNIGDKFGKSPYSNNKYIIHNTEIKKYYTRKTSLSKLYFVFYPIIELYLENAPIEISYYPPTDEFIVNNKELNKNYIILNKEEANKLCELAKMFNPDTKYATGTKDLPVSN